MIDKFVDETFLLNAKMALTCILRHHLNKALKDDNNIDLKNFLSILQKKHNQTNIVPTIIRSELEIPDDSIANISSTFTKFIEAPLPASADARRLPKC